MEPYLNPVACISLIIFQIILIIIAIKKPLDKKEKQKSPPTENQNYSSKIQFCHNCNKKITTEDNFCPNCGKPTKPDNTQLPPF